MNYFLKQVPSALLLTRWVLGSPAQTTTQPVVGCGSIPKLQGLFRLEILRGLYSWVTKGFSPISLSIFLVLASLLGGGRNAALAQCAPTSVPTVFSTWNWEEPEFDAANSITRQDYCNTWAARIIGIPGREPMGAPWIRPKSTALERLSTNDDYTRARGWELLRFDFGGVSSVAVPYFILYHKATGVLRIFVYMTETGLTGAVIRMSHSDNNVRSNAGLSLRNSLLRAPDKYLATKAGNEQTTYVSFYAGKGWMMGQFTMLFDPNIRNADYNMTSYQFEVYGMVKSEVTLAGQLEFKTTAADKDYSFSGPAEEVTSAKTIAANGKKFLGSLADVGEKIGDLNDKAKKTADLLANRTNPVMKGLRDLSLVLSESGKGVKAIAGVAGQLGGIFGIAGSIIGIFSPDDAAKGPAFIPSVSKGTITMAGTITTSTSLASFFMLAPGAANGSITSTANSQLPYYNCPLGIFAIRNTPVLEKVDYQRRTQDYIVHERFLPAPSLAAFPPGSSAVGTSFRSAIARETVPHTSYKLTSNIMPVVNAASGLEIVAVKIAIAQKVPLSSVTSLYNDALLPASTLRQIHLIRTYNFLNAQLASGALEVYPHDPGTKADGSDAQVIVQTPFQDAGCISASGSIPFNITTPSAEMPVYLRLIAELRPLNAAPGAASTFFAQDYAVDIVTSSAQATTGGLLYEVLSPPPFQLVGDYYTMQPALYQEDNVQRGRNKTYFGNDPAGFSNLSEVSNNTLLFDFQSTVFVEPATFQPVVFYAPGSVGIAGEISAPSGVELVISPDIKEIVDRGRYYCPNPGASYGVANLPCVYDLRARVKGGNAESVRESGNPEASKPDATLTLSPNPATSKVRVRLAPGGEECIQRVDVLNIQGQVVWTKSLNCTQILDAEIPTGALAKGLYIVRVSSSARSYTSKLMVE